MRQTSAGQLLCGEGRHKEARTANVRGYKSGLRALQVSLCFAYTCDRLSAWHSYDWCFTSVCKSKQLNSLARTIMRILFKGEKRATISAVIMVLAVLLVGVVTKSDGAEPTGSDYRPVVRSARLA
jgi:hypothetical protein